MINSINIDIENEQRSSFCNSNNTFVNLKNLSQQLAAKYSFLNNDINLFGQFRVIEYINGESSVNMAALADGVEEILRVYKEKIKMLQNSDDKIRFSDSEIMRIKKILSKKSQEYETVAADCDRLRDTLHDVRAELKAVGKQLTTERNNMKVLNANMSRERNQMKNDKTKYEKETTLLKERMTKLLSEPKKAYSSIELNSSHLLPLSSKTVSKSVLVNEKYENQINEELIASFRRQLEEVTLENRQQRELLVNHLVQIKLLSQDHEDISSRKFEKQRNNSGSSVHSSSSDVSAKSNETFILPNSKSVLDERLYLEMPFTVIKEDLMNLFNQSYESIGNSLKGFSVPYSHEKKSSSVNEGICTCVDLIEFSSIENISRLQKEIFQLRRQLIDYESIIQSKDSLIEVAIEQRIRRGSLLPSNQSCSSSDKSFNMCN